MIEIVDTFLPHNPSGLWGIVVAWAGGQQGRQALLVLWCLWFFMDHFQTWQGHSCPNISDEFDYGGSALLKMCIIDHLMSWSILAFLGSFLKPSKFGTNVGLNMLLNLSFKFYHGHKICVCVWGGGVGGGGWIFYVLSNFAHWKWPLTLSHP